MGEAGHNGEQQPNVNVLNTYRQYGVWSSPLILVAALSKKSK
jgi:hypothetical protein